MAIDRPGNGDKNDFEDDVFDAESDFAEDNFEDEAFDEAAYDAELEANAGEYAEEDFDDPSWEEGTGQSEEAPERTKKKKFAAQGARKFLNFNSIVIIAAVIVGGAVMLFTIRNESAELSGQQNIFQSMLNIAGVMDRTLFGEEGQTENAAGDQQQAVDAGFLNDPAALDAPVAATDQNPPQPIPLAPEEGNSPALADSPVTPLPSDMASAEIPRGPEEGLPEDAPAVEAAPEINPAEALLKQAMQSREDKKGASAPSAESPPLPISKEIPAPQNEPSGDAVTVAETQPVPAPAPPLAAPSSNMSSSGPDPETRALIEENTKAMGKIAATLTQISSRVEKIETDVGSVKQRQEEDIKSVRDSIDQLRENVTALKNRPVATAPSIASEKKKPEIQAPEKTASDQISAAPQSPKQATATVKKEAPPKKARVDREKARPAQAPPKKTAGRWELRAAQPGRAWISRAGQRDMQSVQIGQDVSGLGRITAISYQNGRWSVVGTSGRIDQ